MLPRFLVNPREVKEESEAVILAAGGKICDWLPCIDRQPMRSLEEVVGRALVMDALLFIYFETPVQMVKDWVLRNGVDCHLSKWERSILQKAREDLAEQELISLYWYIESLWALLWVGRLIDELRFDRPIEDWMATLVPNLREDEDGSKLSKKMELRSYSEVFRMLDLYYRLHWYARDGRLRGYSTDPIDLDIVMERRKALEWVMDSSVDWDEVDLST